MQARLPSPDQRLAAKQRLVDVAIASSSWPEVHADENGVRERVLRTGRNAIDLASHPIVETMTGGAPDFAVVVEQHVEERFVRFLARRDSDRGIVPTLDLRPRVRFAVASMSQPLAFCESPEALDVTPCVDASELALESAGARLDGEGIVHFAEALPMEEVLALLTPDRRFALPLRSDAKQLASLAPPLDLPPPPRAAWGDGRDLEVVVFAHGSYLLARAQ